MLLLVAAGGTYILENPMNSLVALHPRFIWLSERLLEHGIIVAQSERLMCQLLSCLLIWVPFLFPFGPNLGTKRAPQKDTPFRHSFSRRELKEAGLKSRRLMGE